MGRKFFSPHHVETLALLPETLTPGVAYFVDDENSIIIDFGDGLGAHTYGGTHGYISATPSTGNGFLQDQINTLSGGVLLMAVNFWQETQDIREKLEHLASRLEDESSNLRGLSDKTAEGILWLCRALYDHTGKTDAAIQVLTEQVADIQARIAEIPEIPPSPPPPPPPPKYLIWADLLRPGDQVMSDGYTWQVVITMRDASCLLLVLDLVEEEPDEI